MECNVASGRLGFFDQRFMLGFTASKNSGKCSQKPVLKGFRSWGKFQDPALTSLANTKGTKARMNHENTLKGEHHRAIMLVGWGPQGTLDAELAVRRLPVLSEYDVYIVSDYDLTLATPAQHLKVEFELPHTLRKAEAIASYSPTGYSSILYIDSDITLLEDVPFVFEKAELHGLALAIAPTYLLDEYRTFGRVMDREGVPQQGQVQYQAGLIAFSKTPEVLHVFKKWIELGFRHTDIWIRDQPQLSLSLELSSFQPYVLSKNYNFRGLFEPAIGQIRVWHSHSPVPANLNSYSEPYPPRLLAKDTLRPLRRFEIDRNWLHFYWRKHLMPVLYKVYVRLFRRK
jgi:hypothetical protein